MIETKCSCLLKINLRAFTAFGGLFLLLVFYEFLEPNRHFALNMGSVRASVYGPRRCEVKVLVTCLLSVQTTPSSRVISGSAVCAAKCSQADRSDA
jgi:hypothetical protein